MKIVVCVKQVPATGEQRLDPVTGTVIREGVASILNPFDAYALEEAVRLKERLGGEITALSMGVPSAQETLRRALAVGADRAVLLSGRAFAGADTLATARALALAIRKLGGADLVLCGRMATDGDTAQVGPMLAELLGIPHAADVSRVERVEDGRVTLERMSDDGYPRGKAAAALAPHRGQGDQRAPASLGDGRSARRARRSDGVGRGGRGRFPGGHRPARLAHARGAHGAPGEKGGLPHAGRLLGADGGAAGGG